MARTGTTALAETMRRLLVWLAWATLLSSCTTTEATRAAVGVESLLEQIGLSADGALSRIRILLPSEGTRVLAPTMHRPAAFDTSDGYTVERISINLDLQEQVTSYAFHLAEGKCMPLDAMPGFDQAKLRPVPTYPPGSLVRGSYQDWVLDLPQAWVSIIPQANNRDCIARIGVDRKRRLPSPRNPHIPR